ncbi:MAG: dehydrogenase [Pseudonocardiales bacterium]|nr:dehydrogenase [Pseudonocardiales bacterium]
MPDLDAPVHADDPTPEAYGQRAVAWLAGNAVREGDTTAYNAAALGTTAGQKAYLKQFFDAGFSGITWPKAYQGQGLSDEHQLAFNRAAADYVSPGIFGISHGMFGPTLLALGSEEQKQYWIPKMINGDHVWCQLFSEPGAGSDVAGLRTRAERDGDEWVINGQKVWTSGAQRADYGALIARTDNSVPKHNGITMFILDMKDPGVTVRPLRQASGESPFNEVFFDNVRLPADSIVGEENGGWAAAVIMLRNERISIGTSARKATRPLSYESVLTFARKVGRLSDPLVRDRMAHLYAIDTAGNLLAQRMRQEVDAGYELRARGSIAKLSGSAIIRHAYDVVDEVGGSDVIAWDKHGDDPSELNYPPITFGVVDGPGRGIGGGTNEIQRGIIGERVLGLAKDPQLDREIPFNQLRAIIPPPPTR